MKHSKRKFSWVEDKQLRDEKERGCRGKREQEKGERNHKYPQFIEVYSGLLLFIVDAQ